MNNASSLLSDNLEETSDIQVTKINTVGYGLHIAYVDFPSHLSSKFNIKKLSKINTLYDVIDYSCYSYKSQFIPKHPSKIIEYIGNIILSMNRILLYNDPDILNKFIGILKNCMKVNHNIQVNVYCNILLKRYYVEINMGLENGLKYVIVEN